MHANPRHPTVLEVKDNLQTIRDLQGQLESLRNTKDQMGILRQRTIERLASRLEIALEGLHKARQVGRSKGCLTEERFVIEQALAKIEGPSL